MGVDVFLCLVNVPAYRSELLPACRSFVDADDNRRLIELLHRVPVASDDEAAEPQLRDLTMSQLAEIMALPPRGARIDAPRRDALVAFMEGRRVEPRYLGGWFKRGTANERRDFIRAEVASLLFEVVCVPDDRGVRPWQNMGRTAFTPYLYEHSRYYEEIFTFGGDATEGDLEFGPGVSSEWLKRPVVVRLREELAKVPRPEDGALLQRQYDNLGLLLDVASSDPALAIVRTVS